MNLWRRLSPRQKVIGLSVLIVAAIVFLTLWSRAKFLASEDLSDSTTPRYALNFIIKERVGDRALPAQGFIVIKPNCRDPKQPDAVRLYLTQGGVYCTIEVGGDTSASVDSASFTSTRQNKLFRLPLSGEKSLSKFWVSESLTIEATVNTDGTVSLTIKPTRVF